jgi:hypothetical protein
MSALGQKQIPRDVRAMSALPPKADMPLMRAPSWMETSKFVSVGAGREFWRASRAAPLSCIQ